MISDSYLGRPAQLRGPSAAWLPWPCARAARHTCSGCRARVKLRVRVRVRDKVRVTVGDRV